MAEEPPALEITTEVAPGDAGVLLVVAGEVDLVTAESFETAIADAQRQAPRVLIDIRDVTFMDSTGLRALLEARRRATDGGGEIALRLREDGAVARLLDLAGVSDMFPRHDGDG